MRNLLQFLIKHHFILLFLLLEVIALSILVRFNEFHGARIYRFKHAIVGRISEKYNNYTKYISLVDQNKMLVEENARLYNELKESMYILADSSMVDSTTFRQYTYMPAKVVNNSVNKQYNYITLNKGAVQGVEPDMGVVGPQGIVGIVINVTKHFSSVLPVINRKAAPNARIKNSNYFGHIMWPGRDPEKVILKNIPLHAKINIGDTVETSGNSAIYPQGVMIGSISNYEIVNGVDYDIQVELSTDFYSLTDVMIIKNYLKEEQQALEDAVLND